MSKYIYIYHCDNRDCPERYLSFDEKGTQYCPKCGTKLTYLTSDKK